MLRLIRYVLAVFCLLCLNTLSASANSLPPVAAAPNEIVIAYSPFASPSNVVMETVRRDRLFQQELDRHGVKARFIPVTHGADASSQFKNAQVNVVTMGDMAVLELAATTKLAIVSQIMHNYAMVVTAKGLTSKDLKGKRVGYVKGTTAHFTLLKTLYSIGMSEKDIQMVPVSIKEMPEALESGRIDAFAAWEPTPSIFINTHPNRYMALSRHSSKGYLVVNPAYLTQNPAAVKHLIAAVARAMNWLKSDRNRQQAAEWNLATKSTFTGKPPAESRQSIAKLAADDLAAVSYSPRLPAKAFSPENSQMAQELFFLQSIDKLPKEMKWEEIRSAFRPKLADEVLKNQQKFKLNQFRYE